MSKSNEISQSCNEYNEHYPLWMQTSASINGKAAILKMQGIIASPLYKADATDRTAAYWMRARYFNATGRTLRALNGMIWSKSPVYELPPMLEYLENKGAGLSSIAQVITRSVVGIGRIGSLVDMPENGGGATVAEMQSGEKSPCIITYTADKIIYWRYDADLLEVRLSEVYQEKSGDLSFENKEQVRRLVIIDGVYHNQVWRGDELYTDNVPLMNGASMPFIPFQFFGADNNQPSVGSIPLFDLGSQNLGHFMLDADNRDNLHYHGQGLTVVYTDMSTEDFKLANPNGFDVGAKGLNQLSQGDKVEILQIDASGAISTEMERDEKRMIMMGAEVVTDSSGNQTATAKVIDADATTSTLKQVSMNCSQGMTNILNWCAGFVGIAQDIEYKLNRSFSTDKMSEQMVLAHFQAVQGSMLPATTFFDTARKAGLTDLGDEDLKTLIGEEAMGLQGTSEELAALMAENERLKLQIEESE